MVHERFEHPKNGPVHVFYPRGHNKNDGMTIFVHGFDLKGRRDPWYADALIEDFSIEHKVSISRTKAAFVVIESRVGKGKPVYWSSLASLFNFPDENNVRAARYAHAIGHSGAYANIAMWLKEDAVKHVSLLDATYGQFNAYAAWLLRDDWHRLDIGVHKGTGTHKGAWKILSKLRDYHTWQKMPEEMGICQTEYLVFPYSHMKWVEPHEVIPMLLNRAQAIRDGDVGC